MRILFISFYFPPDLCAGSFRAGALVRELSKQLSSGDKVDVITTVPNRYASYSAKAPDLEKNGQVAIRRISVPSHQSGMIDQSVAFALFALRALREVGMRRYDIVFATTSRMMTGFLGALIARKIAAPLYLDIRDIFPDTMEDILSSSMMRFVLPLFRWAERFMVRTARRINLVSEGFYPYFLEISDNNKFAFFPNGVDEEFITSDFHKGGGGKRPIILYAGNIGAGQGLHRIVPEVAVRLKEEYLFIIVGDGGMRRKLEEELEKRKVSNVRLLDPLPRSELLELYAQADYLFLHLNDYEAFRKVLPSKIFEYAATGKPIVAGVSGYCRKFICENIEHAAVFDPCDAEGFIRALRSLSLGIVGRDRFIRRFRRTTLMRGLASDILRTCRMQ